MKRIDVVVLFVGVLMVIGLYIFHHQISSLFGQGHGSSHVSQSEELGMPPECLEKPEAYARVQCLLPYFVELTHLESAEAAIRKAQELQREGVIDDCHAAAHGSGHANFHKYESDVGQAFATCPLGCIEGCFHGVMESYVETKESLDEVIAEVPKLCASVGTDEVLRRQCIHGIGHGILRHEIGKLVEIVGLCRKLPDEFHREACLGGVFMENMNNYLSLSESSLRAELTQVCDPVSKTGETKLLTMCLEAIGEGLMFYSGHNLTRSLEICTALPVAWQQDCVRGAKVEAETNVRGNL